MYIVVLNDSYKESAYGVSFRKLELSWKNSNTILGWWDDKKWVTRASNSENHQVRIPKISLTYKEMQK